MTGFSGFSPAFFAFFAELADNNNRQWFQDNKSRYQAEVVAQVSAFIAAVAPHLHRVSPNFVADPKPNGGSMFRIYRDVRFSKDKRPYKLNAGCHFRHAAGKDAHAPGFYVHLEPSSVFFGGGIWQPPNPALARIRQAIVDRADDWSNVIDDDKMRAVFGGIRGDGLKRPPRGFDPDHRHIEDLKRKTFFAMHEAAASTAGRGDFAETVGETFQAAAPFMRFLTKAMDQPF